MEWINMSEEPSDKENHFLTACKYEDGFGYWEYSKAKWCDSWYVWNSKVNCWIDYEHVTWCDNIHWLKEKR